MFPKPKGLTGRAHSIFSCSILRVVILILSHTDLLCLAGENQN